ncbi:MAG: hydroxymethylbilane synthase [Gammaproteobacteria bacterium]|nr:hydroxymethylbilane synthase [Gammaproteobacteria bacterium]
MSRLVIATRKSPLAIKQTEQVSQRLRAYHPDLTIELLPITTLADQFLKVPLTEMGGKGVFVKELEEALLAHHADIAVHSMKDVPMELPPGLSLPVVCPRVDPRDVLVANEFTTFEALPPAALIGTSSLRRQSQLLGLRPDLNIVHLRGNVNSRLKRLDQGEFAGLILAAAGLKRLELESRITDYFSPQAMLPAAGQGALGIECRSDDKDTLGLIESLQDISTLHCVQAERAMCTKLGAGCMVPVAAYAEMHEEMLHLRGLVADESGAIQLRAEAKGHFTEAEILGTRVADALLKQGAAALLAALKQ